MGKIPDKLPRDGIASRVGDEESRTAWWSGAGIARPVGRPVVALAGEGLGGAAVCAHDANLRLRSGYRTERDQTAVGGPGEPLGAAAVAACNEDLRVAAERAREGDALAVRREARRAVEGALGDHRPLEPAGEVDHVDRGLAVEERDVGDGIAGGAPVG